MHSKEKNGSKLQWLWAGIEPESRSCCFAHLREISSALAFWAATRRPRVFIPRSSRKAAWGSNTPPSTLCMERTAETTSAPPATAPAQGILSLASFYSHTDRHAHAHTHTHTHTQRYMRTHTCTHTHTHTRTHTRAHTHTHTPPHMSAHTVTQSIGSQPISPCHQPLRM
jgi:hypothetical protein